MKKISNLILISTIILFSECKKKVVCGNDVAAPVITSNSPVKEQGNLQLLAASSEPDLSYIWSGPNNFSSTEQNPLIAGASYDAAGTYKLSMFSGDCPAPEVTMDVSIIPSCAPANNSVNYDNYFFNQTYTSCSGSVILNRYTIEASILFGSSIYFYFNKNSEPAPGIYNIENDPCNSCQPNDVSIELNTGIGGQVYTTGGGRLFVEKTGGKLIVTFCGLNVSNGSVSTTAEGKLTVN